MDALFKRILDLWSKEIAKQNIDEACAQAKSDLWNMDGEDIKIMLATGIRQSFIPEDPNSTPYSFDDMLDFLQWLHERFDLPTVSARQ